MKALFDKIANNSFFIVGVGIATIIGMIIGFAIPCYQAKRVRLSFSYSSNLLVTDKLSEMDDLEIKYKGNEIDQLTVTSCEICNTGNVTIEDNDVYDGHKLMIQPVSDNSEVIFVRVVSQSYDTNNFQVSYDTESVTVRFNTLEKNEKGVINIYHSGDENTSFSIEGKVREGKIVSNSKSLFDNQILNYVILYILCVETVIRVVEIIFIGDKHDYFKKYKRWIYVVATVLPGLIIIALRYLGLY